LVARGPCGPNGKAGAAKGGPCGNILKKTRNFGEPWGLTGRPIKILFPDWKAPPAGTIGKANAVAAGGVRAAWKDPVLLVGWNGRPFRGPHLPRDPRGKLHANDYVLFPPPAD